MKRRPRGFRDLPLTGKLTSLLVAVFALLIAVFFIVLYPLQQRQLDDLLAFNRSVLQNLERVYRSRLIYDLLGESGADESLQLSLTELMATDDAILYAKIVDPEGGLFATTEPAAVEEALREARAHGELRPVSSSEGRGTSDTVGCPILLRRRGEALRLQDVRGDTWLVESERGLSNTLADELAKRDAQVGFQRSRVAGKPALVMTNRLVAGDDIAYGTLQLAYSLERVERSRSRTRLFFVALAATLFVSLLVLLNLMISRIVIGPLRSVFRGMRAAGAGDLDQELEVRSRDEIGEMSSIFNQMVRKLRVSKQEIEQYSRDLEGMVSERTGELRSSQEQATLLKNYLAALIENVGAGVVSVDAGGRITTFNERAAEILEVDASAMEGRAFAEAFDTGVLAEFREAAREAAEVARAEAAKVASETGSPAVREAPAHESDGLAEGSPEEAPAGHDVEIRFARGRRTLALRVTRLESRAGEDLGQVIVFDDITRLVYSKKLTAWKEAVEKVIHEIKNPLTPIRLSTQQLRAAFEDRSPRFDQMFERGTRTILSSVESLQQLVADFSHFYRLHPAKLAPNDLNEIVEEVRLAYAEGLPEGVSVECELGIGMPPVLADPIHLKRVLANLVQNGVDAMEGRTGRVLLRTEWRPERGHVVIRVEDEGRGMDPDEADKVFEPYFTTKIKGTGLGLIITKQIVEEHRGEIRIRSRRGKGTRVEIRLPARSSSTQGASGGAAPPSGPSPTT